jgi:hypothetical protein
MKKIPFLLIPVFLYSFFISNSCKKSSFSLPPITQTGANTFGCLVDGKILTPETSILNGGPYLNCVYRKAYDDTAKAYTFQINAEDKPNNSCNFSSIEIGLDSVRLKQGNTYELSASLNSNGNAPPGKYFGSYTNVTCSQSYLNVYSTSDSLTGQLTITYIDQLNYIISGTFYFKALNAQGDAVDVTNGRFDVKYTP